LLGRRSSLGLEEQAGGERMLEILMCVIWHLYMGGVNKGERTRVGVGCVCIPLKRGVSQNVIV